MELLLFIVGAIVLLVIFLKDKSKNRYPYEHIELSVKNDSEDGYPSSDTEEIPEWLIQRWEAAKESPEEYKNLLPKWFFDSITDRQRTRLEGYGWEDVRDLSKGQASDLIGLSEPADERDLDILKFFNFPAKKTSQTHATHFSTLLLMDSEKREEWETRPAESLHKEFYKFVGLDVPSNLTQHEAERFKIEFAEDNDDVIEDWYNLESIIDMVLDADFRKEHKLKKPTLEVIRKAYISLKNKGSAYDDIYSREDLIVSELIYINPKLAKE